MSKSSSQTTTDALQTEPDLFTDIGSVFTCPTLRVKINMIKFRGEHLLTHLVETFQCESEIAKIFKERIEQKIPCPIKEIKIQRLLQKIDCLWQT